MNGSAFNRQQKKILYDKNSFYFQFCEKLILSNIPWYLISSHNWYANRPVLDPMYEVVYTIAVSFLPMQLHSKKGFHQTKRMKKWVENIRIISVVNIASSDGFHLPVTTNFHLWNHYFKHDEQ